MPSHDGKRFKRMAFDVNTVEGEMEKQKVRNVVKVPISYADVKKLLLGETIYAKGDGKTIRLIYRNAANKRNRDKDETRKAARTPFCNA